MLDEDMLRRLNNTAELGPTLEKAISLISKSTVKLVIILRSKIDVSVSRVVREICMKHHIDVFNTGLNLSEFLMDEDVYHIPSYIRRLVDKSEIGLFLDNIEILFDKDLNLNPIQILTEIARRKIVVCSLDAHVDDRGNLIYGDVSSTSRNSVSKYCVIDVAGGRNEI